MKKNNQMLNYMNLPDSMLKILLNLLILSISLGVLGRFTLFTNVSIYPHDIFASGIFLIVLYMFVYKKAVPFYSKSALLAVSFITIGLFSLIINSLKLEIVSFWIALSYLARYAIYISIIFSFQFLDKAFIDTIPKKLMLSGLIFTSLGLIQYFFYNDLRKLVHLGWDEHLYRLFSTFLDPNFAGAYLVLISLIFIGFSIASFRSDRVKSIIYGICFCLSVISILFTYSRSAIIMLFIGLVTLLILKRLFLLLIILTVTISMFYVLFADTTVVGLNPLRMATIEARLGSASEAVEIFMDSPVFGVGFNAYRYAQIRYGFRTEEGTLISNADAGTDNSYLFVLATTGVVGFVVFVLFWVNITKRVYSLVAKYKTAISIVSLSSLIALFFNTVFINSFFYTPILAWIVVLCGSTLNKRR